MYIQCIFSVYQMELTEDELIATIPNDNLYHLAKTPIADKNKHLVKDYPQMYAIGFNAGGRPDGLWISYGNTWISKSKELDNPKFPLCCYIYKVILTSDVNILHIETQEDFEKFDKDFPSYWLNMDYFTVDFTDYTTGEIIFNEKKHKLILSKLRKKPGESVYETLLNNKIIFNDISSALSYCDFYKSTKIPIERFKYKDWSKVALKYQGIIFESWGQEYMMNYLWFQSLDVPSGCIWDSNALAALELAYHKITADTWKQIK